jgi:hypothetical protein
MTFCKTPYLMFFPALACPICLRRGCAPQKTFSLSQVSRLGFPFLPPSRFAAASIRTIALAMITTAAQVEPTFALLAPDCPNSYPHGLPLDKGGTGRQRGNVQRFERRSRPRDRHRGREITAPDPNPLPLTISTRIEPFRPFPDTIRLLDHSSVPV